MLSFMDAFFGYHQILLRCEDQEKTAFISDRGLYYYKVTPFRLKNAEGTYPRLANKVFEPLIRKTMEVYAHDMIIKSVQDGEHSDDL